ncbi:MAG: hypothetical protein PHZ09_05480 [Eubacteriales bacterium]|jgi:hypothetical protein|nr:hypothetical protein [Eubacteriales bacterium]
MTKKPYHAKSPLFPVAILHIAAVSVSGLINIMYSLNFESINAAAAAISSGAAIAVYIYGAAAVCRRQFTDLAGFGIVFWGITLCGFVFYAMFNLFGYPVTINIPNMTALMRLLLVFITLPLLACNYIIAAMPRLWISFGLALILPLSLLVLNLIIYIKIKSKGTESDD